MWIFNYIIHLSCTAENHWYSSRSNHMATTLSRPSWDSSYIRSEERWLRELSQAGFQPSCQLLHATEISLSQVQNLSAPWDHFQSISLPVTRESHCWWVWDSFPSLSAFLSYSLASHSSAAPDAILEIPVWSWRISKVLTDEALGTA